MAVAEKEGAAGQRAGGNPALEARERLRTEAELLVGGSDLSEVDKAAKALGVEMLNAGAGDPFFSRMSTASERTALRASIVMLALTAAPVIIAALEGNLSNARLERDFVHDWGYWFQAILGPPLVVWSLVRFFGSLPRVVMGLWLAGSVRASRDEFNAFNAWATRLFARRFISLAPAVTALVTTCLVVFVAIREPMTNWHYPDKGSWGTVAGWASYAVVYIAFYLLTFAVLRVLVTYRVLKRLFEHDVHIQPLHPDGAGGLKPVGRLCMKLRAAAVAVGLCAVGIVMWNTMTLAYPLYHPVNVVTMLAYVCGVTVAVFLPLHATHRRMAEARHEMLDAINREYETHSSGFLAALAGRESVDHDLLRQMESLHQMHRIAREMPVYPINMTIVYSFAMSLGLPIVIFVIQRYVGMFL